MALTLLILTPLVGFLINSFFRLSMRRAGSIGCIVAFISFICSVYLFLNYSGSPSVVSFFPWIHWNALIVHFSFLVDPLSLIMLLIITGVGFLIHLFSVGYMAGDPRPGRYFSYLNLFLFNMVILVLADNLLLLFVGWEGVGLCSYLLIGFWFQDKDKARAGMKAFIINRIGDAGFLVGMFLFFSLFGSLDFLMIDPNIDFSTPLTLCCLFLLIGAVGKSAQIPLYVWLPDAMAGPTPVSALIHAATMVTAGVYLIIRTHMMWTPLSLQIVSVIGVLTLLLGAYLACRAWDIKKILAYSTVSQLGYMFLALGIGAFSTALFHLLTHAFFKACLFLSAGSVIHGLNGEQDIRKMGSLRKKMPFSFWSFFIGALALMGLPPLSGFFSKDEILYHVFLEQNYTLWILALIGSSLTAFYVVKTLHFVFWKKSAEEKNPHEGGWTMRGPLIGLTALSFVAGIINWPHFMANIFPYHWLQHWLNMSKTSNHLVLEAILAGGSVLFSIIGAGFYFFCKDKTIHFKTHWSLDDFYQKCLVQPTMRLSHVLLNDIEINFIQKGILSIGQYFSLLRKTFVSLQSGYVQNYILFMGIGFLCFIVIILF